MMNDDFGVTRESVEAIYRMSKDAEAKEVRRARVSVSWLCACVSRGEGDRYGLAKMRLRAIMST